MTDAPAPRQRSGARHHVQRPGPVAWLVIGIGFAVMAWALLGVFREAERTAPASWFTWVIGGAIVRAGDMVIDGSLRGKLNKLADTLTQA